MASPMDKVTDPTLHELCNPDQLPIERLLEILQAKKVSPVYYFLMFPQISTRKDADRFEIIKLFYDNLTPRPQRKSQRKPKEKM
jgi:hypothetical protein